MDAPPLILASGSPQRRAILAQVGISFEVITSGVEEVEEGSSPEEIAQENARLKAHAVCERVRRPAATEAERPAATEAERPAATDGERSQSSVLGVDTVVALEGQTFGKPADAGQARDTLRALSGRRHQVISGLCLLPAGDMPARETVARTTVTFRPLTDEIIRWYVACEEWRERAGAYAIQGRGAALVSSIAGDYLNVVGLPLVPLLELAGSLLALPAL